MSTTVVVQPPSGQQPSVLQLGANNYFPATDGSWQFMIPSFYIPQLLQAGWSVVVPGGTTHVP
jgi:hypothetical protein